MDKPVTYKLTYIQALIQNIQLWFYALEFKNKEQRKDACWLMNYTLPLVR